MLPALTRHLPSEGGVLGWRAAQGPLPRTSWHKPFSWTTACPGLEWRRRNEHPAPIRAPALSPQSPSFALLLQHLGLAPS